MITALHEAGFPGPPHRIREVSRQLKQYDYNSKQDLIGCDTAPLPADLLNSLDSNEQQWFREFILHLHAAGTPIAGKVESAQGHTVSEVRTKGSSHSAEFL